jgi:hypothetical protein
VWVNGQCTGPATCPPERVVAGGRGRNECLAEWTLLPGPDLTASGRPRNRMTCTDGDPGCDAGSTPGECTMRVALCLAVPDANFPSCTPGPLTSYTLLRPNGNDERRGGTPDIQNRALLRAALRALGAAPAPGACTPFLDLRVPAEAPRGGRRIVRGRAVAGAASDNDRLELLCRP